MNLFNLLFIGICAATRDSGNKISVEDREFIDEFGRQIILHGVNIVYKVDPYLPQTD
jgi:hypothetical protein